MYLKPIHYGTCKCCKSYDFQKLAMSKLQKIYFFMTVFFLYLFLYGRHYWMIFMGFTQKFLHVSFKYVVGNTKHFLNFVILRTTLHEKCPHSQLFSFVFSRIQTEHGEIRSIFPYSVQMRENTDQNNSEYEHFLHSAIETRFSWASNFWLQKDTKRLYGPSSQL